MKKLVLFLLTAVTFSGFTSINQDVPQIQNSTFKIQNWEDTIHYPEEVHFKNIQQLTFGGDNAEAYWSYDSKYIVFQRTQPKEGLPCDQIFVGKVPQKTGDKFEY